MINLLKLLPFPVPLNTNVTKINQKLHQQLYISNFTTSSSSDEIISIKPQVIKTSVLLEMASITYTFQNFENCSLQEDQIKPFRKALKGKKSIFCLKDDCRESNISRKRSLYFIIHPVQKHLSKNTDSKLSFTEHINEKINKAMKSFGMLMLFMVSLLMFHSQKS